MNDMVKERQIRKVYWAIVRNIPSPDNGRLEDFLIRNEKQNKSYVVSQQQEGAKLAVLDYRLLSVSDGGYGLLEIELHTGRHHQIRCQLSHAGCPIRGDLKYGAPRSNTDGSISLHAREISFLHPIKKEPITIVAPWNCDNIPFIHTKL